MSLGPAVAIAPVDAAKLSDLRRPERRCPATERHPSNCASPVHPPTLYPCSKAEEIVQRLLAYEAGEVPPPTTVRKSGTAAKTPRTSRKAAAPSPDKAALLRAAASTPLPTGQQKEAAQEEEAEEEAPASARGVRRRLSAQAAAAASPAATPRRSTAAPKQRATAAGIATPVFKLVLLTALAAALASLAVPYCQQHDCAELARNLPELASDSASRLAAQARSRAAAISLPDGAAGLYGETRARALAAADAAQAQWAALVSCLLVRGVRRLFLQVAVALLCDELPHASSCCVLCVLCVRATQEPIATARAAALPAADTAWQGRQQRRPRLPL